LKENVDSRRHLNPEALEAFCELIATKLTRSQRYEDKPPTITFAMSQQVDLFLQADQQYGFYLILQWIKFGSEPELSRGDLDRIRQARDGQPRSPQSETPQPIKYAPTPVPDTLELRTILGSGARRIALVNDRNFSVNESGKVRVGKTNCVVHCIEIRTKSVLIQVEGEKETQELFLKPK